MFGAAHFLFQSHVPELKKSVFSKTDILLKTSSFSKRSSNYAGAGGGGVAGVAAAAAFLKKSHFHD